jgi:3-oxoacyl-[acyl-carrier protein] reductase
MTLIGYGQVGDAAVSHFGGLDILVNNSGIWTAAPVEHANEDDYRRAFELNVLGVILTTLSAIPHLREAGCVINISSSFTTLRRPGTSVYTATKVAVNSISEDLAKKLAPRNIRVNIISPGFVVTKCTKAAGAAGFEMEAGIVTQTRLAPPKIHSLPRDCLDAEHRHRPRSP